MSGFDEREQGFERQFGHDQELAFKARARRNKLLGLWAAERLGLSGAAAETYAHGLVEISPDDTVVAKVASDFNEKAVGLDAVRVRVEFDRLGAQARRQLGGAR